jgi:hypothetical protein
MGAFIYMQRRPSQASIEHSSSPATKKTSEFLPSSDENTDALKQILFEGIDDDVFATEESFKPLMHSQKPVQQQSD